MACLVATLGCGGSTLEEPADASPNTDSASTPETSVDVGSDAPTDAPADAPTPVYCGDPEGALPAWYHSTPTKELYVSPSGDDTNDGSAGKPLKTAAAAFKKLAPGTRINLSPGDYDCASISNFAGTASAPGWVRSTGGDARFSCAAGLLLDNVHYLALDGLSAMNATGHGIQLMSGTGPWSSATISNDVVIHNHTFHGNGLAGFKASQARAVYVIGSHFLRGNPMRQAIELVAVDDAVIAGNNADSVGALNEIKGGSRNGRIFGNSVSGGSAGILVGGDCTGEQYLVDKTADFEAKDLVVYDNWISGSETAFRVVDCKDCIVANNTFEGRTPTAFMRVLTVGFAGASGTCGEKKLGNANLRVVNNIFVSEKPPTYGIASNQLPASYLTMHHNLWFSETGDATAVGTDIPFKSEATSLYVDPQLLGGKPLAGSPVIGKGAALPEACTPNPVNIGAY